MLNKLFMLAHAEGGSGATNAQTGRRTNRNQGGVNGRAANGQSLRRQGGETMGQYLRRVGSSVVGATRRTRGVPANVVTRTRGRRA